MGRGGAQRREQTGGRVCRRRKENFRNDTSPLPHACLLRTSSPQTPGATTVSSTRTTTPPTTALTARTALSIISSSPQTKANRESALLPSLPIAPSPPSNRAGAPPGRKSHHPRTASPPLCRWAHGCNRRLFSSARRPARRRKSCWLHPRPLSTPASHFTPDLIPRSHSSTTYSHRAPPYLFSCPPPAQG